MQLLVVGCFDGNVFAGAAGQHQARVRVAAQKGGSRCVVDVQALEQRIKAVAAACAVGTEKLEAEISQRFGLALGRQGLDGFQHLPDRQLGRIGRQGNDAEGCHARAQQQDCKAGSDSFGMTAQAGGDGKQGLGDRGEAQNRNFRLKCRAAAVNGLQAARYRESVTTLEPLDSRRGAFINRTQHSGPDQQFAGQLKWCADAGRPPVYLSDNIPTREKPL